MSGLEYGLWMYCLFLQFEGGDYLPGKREPEMQEGPGVEAVQKTTKQCRSYDKAVRAEVLKCLGFLSTELRRRQSHSCDGRLLDND